MSSHIGHTHVCICIQNKDRSRAVCDIRFSVAPNTTLDGGAKFVDTFVVANVTITTGGAVEGALADYVDRCVSRMFVCVDGS